MEKRNRLVGGVLIVAGTTIGGSMLALPLASASYGFFPSILVLLIMWTIMSYTALLTLEASLYFGKGVSVSYMAAETFGPLGSLISTLSIAGLFYALLAAYISGGSSILSSFLQGGGVSLPDGVAQAVFAISLSLLICTKADFLDLSNRALMLLKSGLFLMLVVWMFPYGNLDNIKVKGGSFPMESFLLSAPVFFTSFGFHGSIPTIIEYVGLNKAKLRKIFIVGSVLPLVVYILWEFLALSVIPLHGENSFETIHNAGGNIGALVEQIRNIIQVNSLLYVTQGFTFLAIATSFLGVGFGMFGFVKEQFVSEKKAFYGTKSWILTFVIPFFVAVFYPNGFVQALGFAAVALSVLAVIMPSLIVLKIRKLSGQRKSSLPVLLALVGGVYVILVQLYTLFI